MPRKTGTSIQNKFIRGLVTEATALSFPDDACTEVSNVVFDPTGRVTRRLGFDTEASYVNDSISVTPGQTYSSFLWQGAGGIGEKSFLVIQEGSTLNFYNTSESTIISTNKHITDVSLDSFVVPSSELDPKDYVCQFASGNDDLIVVNPACEPFFVQYDPNADSFSTESITLEFRDFVGLDDGLTITERVTDSTIGLETSNPNHYYNLLNQGWGLTSALESWNSSRSDLPSNADYYELYRSAHNNVFDSTAVDDNSAGNRPAPKGHYILEVGTEDRQAAIASEGFAFTLTQDSTAVIDRTEGSIFTDFTSNTSAAFDGDTSQTGSSTANKTSANGYIGKDYGASNEKNISKVTIVPSRSFGFLSPDQFNLTITLYGKNTLPASGTDGTNLGSITLTSDTDNAVTVTSNDPDTAYRWVWVYFAPSSSTQIRVCELIMFSNSYSFDKPSCVEFYSGRIFYAGIKTSNLSSNIYFSQIIEGRDQYGKCYQKNDPTASIPDLLSDDGGVIKIPEMGTLKKLYAYQNALLAYANNGVWLISGSSGSNFKADDYQVKKISSIGLVSSDSLISIKGLPAWWGEDGIYTIQFDANYDSFTPISLTRESIDRLYLGIPSANKMFVKGAYDEVEQVAYWLYSEDSNVDSYRYDSVLCLDGKSQAFYIWTIGAGPIVRTINFIKPADRSSEGLLKFMIHRSYNGSTANQTFAEVKSATLLDWSDEGTETDYDSYFVTGYKLDGETQRFFQPNYVFVFLETEDNASCYVQGVYDYTTSSAEGKWSSRQQIYNENLTNRGVNFRRLKVRGKGRALQLRFESESQKPFTIIGWSIWETSNSGI